VKGEKEKNNNNNRYTERESQDKGMEE